MIRKLPPEIVREIAAGEVIGGPADVLKELLENALDALATRLDIELCEGGTTLVSVRDNGRGIPREELPLAAEAHSTSKLESLHAITTLGFRGEGLWAVRNAARLTLTSRPAAQLGGATLTAEGEHQTCTDHPAPQGTLAEVTRLFAHLPARLWALDTPATEERRALTLLSRYLLHHPDLSMRVTADGSERWSYAGGTFADAAGLVWGPVTANRLLPFRASLGGVGVCGLLSRPELRRPKRDRLSLAVNGRPVDWPEGVLRALLGAYRELLPSGNFPVGVVNLDLPPDRVLVNTSPDKRRVRFLDEAHVAEALTHAALQTLGAHPLATPLPELHPAEAVAPAPRHAFPRLEYVGTLHDLYLLAQAQGQLWVVDQHAAHERILFEELERRYSEEPPLELAAPELLPLSLEEEAVYLERREALARRGVELEPFGLNRWRIRRLPAFLLGHPELVGEVVKGSLSARTTDEAWRMVLARLACLPAMKAGHALLKGSAQALLDALRGCVTPWVCPHGRPTALVLSEHELSKRFGRRGIRAVKTRLEKRG